MKTKINQKSMFLTSIYLESMVGFHQAIYQLICLTVSENKAK